MNIYNFMPIYTPLKNPGKPCKKIVTQNILETPWNFSIIPGKPWKT
jgi:hypothetical protein